MQLRYDCLGQQQCRPDLLVLPCHPHALPAVACVTLTRRFRTHNKMQVANQRWLTVGALLVVGVGGLLAADAVSEP